MESDAAAQSISHIRLTFPKRIFEVCYLMKRETEAEFFSEDTGGEFSKHIQISKSVEEQICIRLAVDNLTFEANNLCCYVDKIIAKDEEALADVLEPPQLSSISLSADLSVPNLPNASNNDVYHDIDGGEFDHALESILPTLESEVKPGKKCGSGAAIGRPQRPIDNGNDVGLASHANPEAKGKEDSLALTPSGRRIRKPARFRQDSKESDDTVKEADAGLSIGEDYDGNGSGFNKPVLTATAAQKGSNEGVVAESDKTVDGEPGPAVVDASVSDLHVVLVKRKRGRPRKADVDDPDKKPHGARGKKRPNYKREANIECKFCHNMYKDELSLIAHVQKLHVGNELSSQYIAELKESAKVQCKLCGKTLGNKRNEMTSHMLRVHGKDDDFISKCDECGMEFKRSFLLKEHIRRQHPKHDRILCHLCPASFKLKEYLTEHLKYTHNKQFKWQCDICLKMTSSPKNLRRHKRLHEGLQFLCPICNKAFGEAGNMKRHILYVHNAQAVSRHRCNHCERDFTTKNNLIQHINLVHLKTTAFYCDICKKYFARKKLLIEHATLVHPGVPILSTKMDADGLASQMEQAAMPSMSQADDQQGYATLAGVNETGGQATIIIQGPNGTEHVLMAHGLEGQQLSVPEMQQAGPDVADDELHQTVPSVNIMGGDGTAALSDSSLSHLAQQALAAFEAGGLQASEFGAEQYLSVIGEDGQEIRVQIVRKDAADQDQVLDNIYVQAAAAEAGLNLDAHVEQAVAESSAAEAAADTMEGDDVAVVHLGDIEDSGSMEVDAEVERGDAPMQTSENMLEDDTNTDTEVVS